ncbi:MAG: hypothetical protein KF760_20820 [Candidatus Eremiobacteraeota bacterium]|nr:hypothetical protein [Candidatus Eremiobacteraeota bacterium]MCW5871563.1 hypothetical protein [Candidatus Eremiobacteraeota bacterium]
MIRVNYPDLEVCSGEYRAEARSPDPREHGHQRNFRYRLLDSRGRVLWERAQPEGELSPRELYLADDGWLVIRTHGWNHSQLIALAPTGSESVRISVVHPLGDPPEGPPGVFAPTAQLTTAGMSWAEAALTFFLSHQGERYFSVMPAWGERFSLNLARGELHTGDFAREVEQQFAESFLKSDEPYEDISTFLGVLGVIQRQKIERLVPLVQALWRGGESREGSSTACHALPELHRTTQEPLATMCLVLASLNGLEPGPACYSFEPGWEAEETTVLPVFPQRIPDRSRRLARLHTGLNSLEVLESAGCPDFMQEVSEQDRWGSQWDYYTQHPLEVTRILWEPGSDGRSMRSLERLPFTSDDVEERLRRLLSF